MKTSLDENPQPKRVLTLVFDGIEEVEALAPVDILRRAGVQTTMASAQANLEIEGRNGIRFLADQTLEATQTDSFDLLFIPGGPGVLPLAENPSIVELVQSFERDQKYLAAICAAPKVLANAGILDDRPATSHQSVRDALPIPSDETTLLSKRVLTSQGAGTAIECGIQMAALLVGESIAQTIADSIHAPKTRFL